MTKVNELLSSRFIKTPKQHSKMAHLAERSSSGNLSSFSGIFQTKKLSQEEEDLIYRLLTDYAEKKKDVSEDLKKLCVLTSEVKAINNQAAILHGERIKEGQKILKEYRDGAFTHWLVATYGNRQTPYNFLKYYELYSSISKPLQNKIDEMPRQAIYTLATRDCSQQEKTEIIVNYRGETKKELLRLIRERFPLKRQDKRASNMAQKVLQELKEIEKQCHHPQFRPSKKEKSQMKKILLSIEKLVSL